MDTDLIRREWRITRESGGKRKKKEDEESREVERQGEKAKKRPRK